MFDMSQLCSKLSRRSGVALTVLPVMWIEDGTNFGKPRKWSGGGSMNDYIDRQAAIDAICKHGTELERRGITVLTVVNHKQVTVDLLENLPSAEVVPVKHGRWIVVSDGYGNGDATAHICECSECKDTIWVYKKATRRWNYCPNCGAKMEPISASPENGQEVEA